MQPRILPFYMTYPLPICYEETDTVKRDLEYLQQMYPKTAKKYQRMVYETLQILDYEGSVIYDEYPDRLQLEQITDTIVQKMKQREKQHPVAAEQEEMPDTDEKWALISEMVQIILYYEIYRRRHAEPKGFLKF